MKALLFLICLSLVSCASKSLTQEEASVRVTDATDKCKEMGKVNASSGDDTEREDDLRKQSYKAGGNTVVITKRDKNTTYGTAYKCP